MCEFGGLNCGAGTVVGMGGAEAETNRAAEWLWQPLKWDPAPGQCLPPSREKAISKGCEVNKRAAEGKICQIPQSCCTYREKRVGD